MSPDEREYYRERASAERKQAATSTNPHAKEIHVKLACLYEKLVGLEEDSPGSSLPATRGNGADQTSSLQ
jgi:hypothetical protein